MRVDLDKNLNKDVFYIIKSAIGYPSTLAWNKISHLNFCKLAKIIKENDNFVQVVYPFDTKFK